LGVPARELFDLLPIVRSHLHATLTRRHFGARGKVISTYVPADTSRGDETNLDDLRKELASLEAAETKISAERRRLHDKIDYGFADAATHAREREISDERKQLHQRIETLRELLGGSERDP